MSRGLIVYARWGHSLHVTELGSAEDHGENQLMFEVGSLVIKLLAKTMTMCLMP